MCSAACYKITWLEMLLMDGVLRRPRFMWMVNNACMIALLLLWTDLIKRITIFMESLFKFERPTQKKQNYSGNNRKMWWERLSGEKQKSNRKRIQRGQKDCPKRTYETPHFPLKCRNGLVTWKQAHSRQQKCSSISVRHWNCLHASSILH